MPFFLLGDEWADDPSWDVLSDGSVALADRLQAAYARLGTRASAQRRDGYVTERFALDACRGNRRVLELLATAVLDCPPWLHRPGDGCDCLGPAPWIDGYGYRLHNFLKRNPSRRETDLDRAKKADLKDARLKQLVYERDGGCCRYCRTGPLSPKAGRSKDRRKVLSHDHVDPDRAAGPGGEGFVIACGRCNDEKGHRTPDEADMTLLPAPTVEEAEAWRARGLVLVDRLTYSPSQMEDQPPITDRTVTDQCSDHDAVADRRSDAEHGHDEHPDAVPAGDVRPEHGRSAAQPATTTPEKGVGLGGGGKPVPDPGRPPPDTPRSSEHPDIYTRRSRGPTATQASNPPPTEEPADTAGCFDGVA